jgi:hypothetical protein
MGPFVRIALRYVAGVLVAKGVFAPSDANALFGDPELVGQIEVAAGVAVAFIVEGAYALARKLGWAT